MQACKEKRVLEMEISEYGETVAWDEGRCNKSVEGGHNWIIVHPGMRQHVSENGECPTYELKHESLLWGVYSKFY